MEKSISLPEALYQRLAQHAKGFETPADVIARLLNIVEAGEGAPEQTSIASAAAQPVSAPSTMTPTQAYPAKLPINFHPDNVKAFKKALLKKRAAWVLLHKNDGTHELRQWNAQRFTESSDVVGNLRSGYLRGWREKGIVRADVAIDQEDLETVG